jgi:spermidine/putrescine transport system substrate-binding protein
MPHNMKRTRLLILAVLALAASMVLVACGGGGGINEGSDNEDVPTAPGGKATGSLNISNWTYYIDPKTINEFQKETGIKTTYNEDVNDNNSFFGKVQQQLANGDSGGRDIIIVTDWMAEKMYNLGYIQKLDHDELGQVFDTMIPSLRDPSFDPGRGYSVPWQSGMTGLVVRKDLAPDVKSINDLFDPKYKGKVTLLTELRDTVPLIMAADGIDPAEATTEDWLATIDKIKENVDNGQIRRFTGSTSSRSRAARSGRTTC